MNQKPIETPRQAEELAATWMRNIGFRDARLTGKSADHGIDVTSNRALAQVKKYNKPIGVSAVRELFGARGHDLDKALLFFASSACGYAQPAKDYADTHDVALFTYDLYGTVKPVNRAARTLEKSSADPAAIKADLEARRAADLAEHDEWLAEHNATMAEIDALFAKNDAFSPPKPAPPSKVGIAVVFGCAGLLAVLFTVVAVAGVIFLVTGEMDMSVAGQIWSLLVFFVLAGVCWIAAIGSWGELWTKRPSSNPDQPARPFQSATGGSPTPGPASTENYFSEGDLTWFDYQTTLDEIAAGLRAVHAVIGTTTPPQVENNGLRTTITTDPKGRYVGLTSVTAELEPKPKGIVRVRWYTHSKATPSTVEEVTDAGHDAVERAIQILTGVVGESVAQG